MATCIAVADPVPRKNVAGWKSPGRRQQPNREPIRILLELDGAVAEAEATP